MNRVPNIPPRRPDDPLEEIEQIINPTTPAARRAKAEFIRDELARISKEIDQAKRKSR